ncbi:hypothetical protein BJV78DRAFT_789957 [Lactifluus subvellereus]|nr:hypothetical protein BJV78DRAFT_789957 [Lactifluus subvellereus]
MLLDHRRHTSTVIATVPAPSSPQCQHRHRHSASTVITTVPAPSSPQCQHRHRRGARTVTEYGLIWRRGMQTMPPINSSMTHNVRRQQDDLSY